MLLFDSHCHIEKGLEGYDLNAKHKNIIFNSFESYDRFGKLAGANDCISIIFDNENYYERLEEMHESGKIVAFKIHSRIQKITKSQYPELLDKLIQIQPRVPIIIDAFYFGDDYEFHPHLEGIIHIARHLPNVPIIIAHSGGIEILKYFYFLKNLDNIYFDLSFSLTYLYHSSAFIDFKNLIRFASSKKVLFGTDYPFVSAGKQLEIFLEIATECKLQDQHIENILYNNSLQLLQRKDPKF